MIVTIIPGYLGQMTKLELVAWLRQRGYDGPVSFPKAKLVELCLSVSSPVIDVEETGGQSSGGAGDPETGVGTDWTQVDGSKFLELYVLEGVVTPEHDIRMNGDPGWYHFLNVACNPETGRMWVNVYGGAGGAKGYQQYRAFSLDRIRRKPNGQILTRRHVNRKDQD